MKIILENIDNAVARLVKELTDDLYEYTGESEGEDHLRIATLGEIRGICRMANAMKEVLRS